MYKINVIFGFLFCLLFRSYTFADHPNEGKVALNQLIEISEKENLAIKEAEEILKSLKEESKSRFALMLPNFVLEGGPQITEFDNIKSNSTAVFLKAEWNLYNGGTDQAALDLSRNAIEIQERKIRLLKNKIKNEISKIYYELQFILESISLKQKALAMNAQQIKIALAKNKSGFTTNSDVLEFDLRESTLQSDLVLLNQQLDQKSKLLDIYLSRKDNLEPEIVKGHLVRENLTANREELIKKMLTNNEQLLTSQSELESLESAKNQNQSAFLPKIDLETKYGKLANEEQVYNENNNYTVMLKFNIPLLSGFKDYHESNSINAKLIAQKLNIEEKKIFLITELDALLAEIKALNSRLDLEEKNIERSEKYYNFTLDEYKRGIKNSPDMVGASERLLEARIRNLEYRRDLMLAKSRIQDLIAE